MIARRLSIALIAAASTTLALVTPVSAQEEGSSLDSLTTVSSLSSTGGSGESTTPTTPVEDEPNLPDWAGSLETSPETALAFEIIKAVLAVGLAVTQAAVIMVPLVPGGADMVRNFFAQFGIRV